MILDFMPKGILLFNIILSNIILKSRIILLVIGCFLSINFTAAQVKWYSINEAEKQAATQHKKIMVKVYAKWCGWCKEMDKSTFPNKYVSKILNDSYIPVQFNAEQKENVTWANTLYKLVRPKKGGPYHELAATWLNGRLSYPTIVILDENGKVIQAIPGYRKASEFEKILAYFASDSHTKINYADYEKQYKRR